MRNPCGITMGSLSGLGTNPMVPMVARTNPAWDQCYQAFISGPLWVQNPRIASDDNRCYIPHAADALTHCPLCAILLVLGMLATEVSCAKRSWVKEGQFTTKPSGASVKFCAYSEQGYSFQTNVQTYKVKDTAHAEQRFVFHRFRSITD